MAISTNISEQQFAVVLAALADKIRSQEDTIFLQDCQIRDLRAALAEAQYHLNPNGERPKTLTSEE